MKKHDHIHHIVGLLKTMGIKIVNVQGIVTAYESAHTPKGMVDKVALSACLTRHGYEVTSSLEEAFDDIQNTVWHVTLDSKFLMRIEWTEAEEESKTIAITKPNSYSIVCSDCNNPLHAYIEDETLTVYRCDKCCDDIWNEAYHRGMFVAERKLK